MSIHSTAFFESSSVQIQIPLSLPGLGKAFTTVNHLNKWNMHAKPRAGIHRSTSINHLHSHCSAFGLGISHNEKHILAFK